MKINLSYDQFNDIMDFCKNFVAKEGLGRPILENIEIISTGYSLTVTALDGVKLGKYQISYKGEPGCMVIPLQKKVKKAAVYVEISKTENEIHFKTATGTTITPRPKGDFINAEDIFPKAPVKEVWSMGPNVLEKALNSFKNDNIIDIEYRGELLPLVLKGANGQAVVLPMRRPRR